MRSVLFAYQDVGYVCLETLLELGADIPAVLTHDDDPGETIWFRSVRALAEKHGIPVYAPQKLDAGWIDKLRAWQPDFLFSFYYRHMIPTAVLDTAGRAALNLHGSLLPRYRGRCPVNWVLIHGETETGVTLHHMVEKPDRGDIVAQQRVPIMDDDTARTLYAKLTIAAAQLMRETYPRLVDGTAPRIPQDQKLASYFGGRRPEDGRIHWEQSARAIYNLVRAVTHPYPGAFTLWRGRPLFVWEARPQQAAASQPLGTITAVTAAAVLVQSGDGVLRLQRVQFDNEPECNAVEWAERHDVRPGATLDA